MERRLRKWAGCGLLIVLASAGCRSMHSSVPPGPKFSPDGRQQPSVGFSNDAHAPNQAGNPALNPMANAAPGGGMPGLSGAPQMGTPGVSGSNFGVPAGAGFGPPGSSGGGAGGSPSLNPGAAAGGASGQPSGLPGTN